MKGLRTLENDKFNKFFELVQKEAKKQDSVFFLDCGGGNLFENASFECEDLFGWLIPQEKVNEFENLFLNQSSKQHEFDDFYCSVDFEIIDDNVSIIIT